MRVLRTILRLILACVCACGLVGCAHPKNSRSDSNRIVETYRSNETCRAHLEQIPLGGFEVRDTPLHVVLATFEKTFQDYRSRTPNSLRGLTKTLFKIEASKAQLQQKLTFRVDDKGTLFSGVALLSSAVNDIAVTGRDVGFPMQHGRIVIRSGSFCGADIRDLPSLAARLKQPSDEVSRYLNGRFYEFTRDLLSQCEGPDFKGRSVLDSLVQEFNKVAEGELIYEERRFAGVTLSAETRKLLETKPRSEDLVRLNRMLLEDAYPAEIAKRSRAKK